MVIAVPQKTRSHRLLKRDLKILLCDDVDIVYDMHCQNGNPGCTRFDVF